MNEWWVEVRLPSQRIGLYPVGPGGLTIGRSSDSKLRLVAPTVSRHHAFLRVENGRLLLRDVGSKSGTLLNGQPVQRDVIVRAGDVIQIGPYTLKIIHQSDQSPRLREGEASTRPRIYSTSQRTKRCPRCGTENPVQARYCMQCGTRLVPSEQEGLLDLQSNRGGQDTHTKESLPTEKRSRPSTHQVNISARSFWGSAILVFLFYVLGVTWPVAVIVNWLQYNAAKREEQLTGKSPPGKGCLGLQLFLFFWLPLMGFIILAALILAGSGGFVFEILRGLGIHR